MNARRPQRPLFALLLLVLIATVSGCRLPQQPSDGVVVQPTATLPPTATHGDAVDVQRTEAADSAEFVLVPGASAARFELDEDLISARTGWGTGARITVIGTTDQVFGSFTLDPFTLAATEFGTLRVDAGSFYTDEFFRTRAIQELIFNAGRYPDITFVPDGVSGLPDSAEIGATVTFTLDGTLTIRDVALPQQLQGVATLVSAERIEGTVSAVVTRSAYGLTLRTPPQVSNVEDEVELYVDFVAVAQ